VARGGILRRGVPVTRARARWSQMSRPTIWANMVSAQSKIWPRSKLAVHRGLAPGGWLILNADDACCVGRAQP
jgi:hypothetical protein